MNRNKAIEVTKLYLTGCANSKKFDNSITDNPPWFCQECTDDFFRNRLLPALGIALPKNLKRPPIKLGGRKRKEGEE